MIEADADAAAGRRREAQAEASVDYRRRQDGLVDLFATGLTGPNAQAVLSRIRAHSSPVGSSDDRPAGQRRLDALVDLVLGRDRQALDGELGSCQPDCGCSVGAAVPCGTDVQVLIPLGAALGLTCEPAELVGHGPLDADLTAQLLLAAPVLRPVWVEQAGIPVATGRAVERPTRRDIPGLAAALRRLAASRPGTLVPRHPDDHPDDHTGRAHDGAVPGAASLARPAVPRPAVTRPAVSWSAIPQPAPGPQVLSGPHPTGTPGPYRVPPSLRRLLQARRPRCEWPSCGAGSYRCDPRPRPGLAVRPDLRLQPRTAVPTPPPDQTTRLDQDPHPRRRSALEKPHRPQLDQPHPHQPPAAPDLPPPRRVRHAPENTDDPWLADPTSPLYTDPTGLELRADDTEPADDHDRTGEQLQHTDTRWNLELDNPYLWADPGMISLT